MNNFKSVIKISHYFGYHKFRFQEKREISVILRSFLI
jgi:hypothetical protein